MDFPRTESVFSEMEKSLSELRGLYHYTTPAGLLGIFETGKVWATSALHLNDTTETSYGIDLLKRCAEKISDASNHPTELRDLFTTISTVIGKITPYIFSLSEDSDSLDQWRAYTPETGGFALEFGKDFMQSGDTYFFTKCIYEEEEQEEIATEVVTEHFELLPKLLEESKFDSDEGSEWKESLAMFSMLLAIAMKHSCFSKEEEWRVATHTAVASNPLKFRIAKGGMIPYHEIDLPKTAEGHLPLVSVTVGPSPDQERAEAAAKELISRFSKGECEVKRSKLPYRPR